jgi:DNA-binding MarR family transcriptional regulator
MRETIKHQREGGFLIAKIHQLSNRIFNKKLKQSGLVKFNSAQGRILFVLWRENNLSIRKLSEETQLSKSTLTSMLDRLQDAGILKRVPSSKDRRKILIILTEKGKNLQDQYVDISKEMNKLFYNTLSKDEIENFEYYLRKILDKLIKNDV